MMIYRIIVGEIKSLHISQKPDTQPSMSFLSVRKRSNCLWLLPALLLQMSCDFIGESNARVQSTASEVAEYVVVEWTDLMPEDDLQALLNPPDYLTEVEEGSAEDQRLYEQLAASRASGNFDNLDRYQQALLSTDFRAEFDNKNIRIAGYLVPLEYRGAELVTQALLVPYFGACIHLPPPPPNQVILLNASQGIELDDMYHPYWLSGTLNTSLRESELATSAYEMNVAAYELYSE